MSSWQTSGQTNILRSQLEASTGQCCNHGISQFFPRFSLWLFRWISVVCCCSTSHHTSVVFYFRCFSLLLFSRPSSNILSFSFSDDSLPHSIFVLYCRCIVLPLFCTFVASNSRCCSLPLLLNFIVSYFRCLITFVVLHVLLFRTFVVLYFRFFSIFCFTRLLFCTLLLNTFLVMHFEWQFPCSPVYMILGSMFPNICSRFLGFPIPPPPSPTHCIPQCLYVVS